MAKALAACGAKVAIVNRSAEKAAPVVAEIEAAGGTALAVPADVLNRESLVAANDLVTEKLGTCTILVNGAGGNHPKGTSGKEYLDTADLGHATDAVLNFYDLDAEGMQFVFNLNFIGTLLATQVFTRQMAETGKGTILNISSMSAFSPLTKVAAYSAAKAAINNFTQWLAVHMSKAGIRVNAIAPGFFLTEQNRSLLTNEDGSFTERAQKIISQTPMERFGEADELLGALLWLVDEKAAGFVTGVVVPVDGGFAAFSGV
jgi:NAD(P)-dependent dehydrogenase (short-subunit alcohol dehydrogenase family)